MIRIRRQAEQFTDMLRSYEVALDGTIVGRLNAGEVFEYRTEPGAHTLQLKIDWCGSPIYDFSIEEGKVLDFICGGLSGYKRLLVLPITIFRKNHYLWLKQVSHADDMPDPPLPDTRCTETGTLLREGRKWRFVIRYGVLGWGLTTGVIFQLFRVVTGVHDSLLDWVITLGVFALGGLCWGLGMGTWAVIKKNER